MANFLLLLVRLTGIFCQLLLALGKVLVAIISALVAILSMMMLGALLLAQLGLMDGAKVTITSPWLSCDGHNFKGRIQMVCFLVPLLLIAAGVCRWAMRDKGKLSEA